MKEILQAIRLCKQNVAFVCVRACACACVRACVCACVCIGSNQSAITMPVGIITMSVYSPEVLVWEGTG